MERLPRLHPKRAHRRAYAMSGIFDLTPIWPCYTTPADGPFTKLVKKTVGHLGKLRAEISTGDTRLPRLPAPRLGQPERRERLFGVLVDDRDLLVFVLHHHAERVIGDREPATAHLDTNLPADPSGVNPAEKQDAELSEHWTPPREGVPGDGVGRVSREGSSRRVRGIGNLVAFAPRLVSEVRVAVAQRRGCSQIGQPQWVWPAESEQAHTCAPQSASHRANAPAARASTLGASRAPAPRGLCYTPRERRQSRRRGPVGVKRSAIRVVVLRIVGRRAQLDPLSHGELRQLQ